MGRLEIFMTLWGGAGLLMVWGLWGFSFWLIGRVQRLKDLRPSEPPTWPTVSIIIPACNEADTIEAALTTILGQDYPQLQIVVIDDRSTDSTGERIAQVAARDPRIKSVRIESLPEGWLGKLHAMDQGVREATGEWLLFTDADVHFEAGSLKKTVAFAMEDRLDHLAILPDIFSETFWGKVALETFGVIFFAAMWKAILQSRDARNYVGIGAFNLVRREKFESTEGFAWLKMEVGDDVGLGLMMHRAGARSRLLSGASEMHVTWYRNFPEMAKGLEKNAFPVMARFKLRLLAGSLLVTCLMSTGPLVFALHPSISFAWLAGLSALLPLFAYAWRAKQRFGVPLLATLSGPVGLVLLSGVVLRSARRCLKDGGITWRGTLYPIKQLKAGQRVKLTAFGPKP